MTAIVEAGVPLRFHAAGRPPRSTGDTGAGDPLLLVHGWGGDARAWSGLDFGRRQVVTVDLRGHGHSPVLRNGYRPTDYARDLAGVVERLDLGPVVAVGHSMGGQIVAQLALEYQELVRAVVAVDPAYGADEAEAATFADRLAALRKDGAAAAVRQLGLPAGAVRDQLLATPGHVLADSYAGMYTDPDAFGARPAARARLSGLGQPLLTLRSVPSMAAWDVGLSLPYGSRIALWTGCGHFLHHERPHQFVALLESWLTSLPEPRAHAGSSESFSVGRTRPGR
ncbi:pimeloyl-ACP methyl ester carboxylesterase [Kribbella aluminosa]|uniref:Pimeloyl-ACP methyl ester carboxylesterase n=1 Tax=Kribbella aluminosa TaxID=416017 RepID=A0ABS4UW29_9ACTN|nr:alpha/beta hydrolase [Kribbella aluminosa]MBP2355823.1 pimeloyl-ACP methyl ester carboxylesterase [Kribbella aluminosa]